MNNLDQINQLFKAMNISAVAERIQDGLRTRKYLIKLSIGEKVSKIRMIVEEIALLVNSITKPSIELDTKTGYVIIETTISDKPLNISLDNILKQENLNKYILPLALGKDMDGNNIMIDLATCPHLLIGGSTGSGKSVLIRSMIKTLVSKHDPSDLQLVLIDPKGTELSEMKDSPYTACHISTYQKCEEVFNQLTRLMETRYQMFTKYNVKKLEELRQHKKEPYIVVVIDELADLLLKDKKQDNILTKFIILIQKSRAAGIHIVVNTQRPSRDVINGLIQDNIETRIALKTVSHHNSKLIIGQAGAENLVGMGDMLVKHQGKITRVQGAM